MQENLRGGGNALTARGAGLNDAIAGLPRLLGHLEPVARTLADRDTQLGRFFRELGDAARVVAPVAERYAHQFSAGADVFEAWSRHPDGVRETVRRSPRSLDAGIRSFRIQRPFLADYRELSGALQRAAATLPRALPRITPALREGIPVLRRTPEVNDRLRGALAALDRLMSDPATGVALRGLTDTGAILNPLLRFVGPYVTVCNYFNYAWTHAGEHLTEPDPTGTAQRTLLNQASRPRNPLDPGLGSIGARTPGNGEPVLSGAPLNLHVNTYSAAVDRQGNADCESGQRGYVKRANAFGDPKFNIAVDPHMPGNQGTDVHRPAARARGPDLHARAAERPADPGGAGPVSRAAKTGRPPERLSPFAVGALVIAAVVAITYFAFTKSNPLADHFEVKAPFKSVIGLKKRMPVRVAGVEVGRVAKVESLGNGEPGAMVTMRIRERGLPLHRDATFKVRPRLFLEGNYFVDITSGSPSAPALRRRRHGARHADVLGGVDRPVLRGPAGRHARGPAGGPARARARPGGRRRPWLQPLDPASGARVQVLGDRQHRDAGHQRARPVALRRVQRARGPRPRPQPGGPAIADRRSRDHVRRLRVRAAQPDRGGRRAAADARQRPPRAAIAQRRVPAAAALRAAHTARRCAPPGPPSTRSCRSCASCAAWCPARSCAGSSATCGPPCRGSSSSTAAGSRCRSRGASWAAASSGSSCRGSSTGSPTRSSRRPAT